LANPIELHHLRLLKEIENLANEHGFKYVLANHSAWDAVKFQKYHGNIYETTVMMRPEDVEALRTVLPENRDVIDYDMHGCQAKYVDTMSVLLNYRHDPLAQNVMLGIDIVVAEHSGVQGELEITRPEGGSFRVPNSFFDEVGRGVLEETEFNIPGDIDNYFSLVVSEDWQSRNWPYKLFKKSVYVTHVEDMDPKAFTESKAFKQVYNNKMRAFMASYWYWTEKKYNPADKKLAKYGKYLNRTGDRFALWEKYYPQKQQILEMSKDPAKHDELRDILRELLDKIWYYERERLPLSIDEDLLQVCVPFLIEEHGEKKTQIALDRIPKEYRQKSVEDVLREAGVDHPLLRD